MITKSFRLEDLERVKICIGYVGENEHTQVRIDCSSAFAEYPGATPALAVKPPRGGVYPAVIETEGNVVVWTVTNSDLLFRGEGEIQFSFILGDVIKKTAVGKFDVHRSIITTANVPDPVAEWLVRATAAAAAAEAAALHQPKIESEYWYVWDSDAEEYVSTGVKAKGDKGDPGTPGDPTTLIDDTSTALDKTWSAHELDGLKNALHVVEETTENIPKAVAGIEKIPMNENKYISLYSDNVTMVNGVPAISGDSATYSVGYIACTEGDCFIINGSGGTSTRLFAFIDSTGEILTRAKEYASCNNLAVIAPENSAFIIVHTNDGKTSYKGESLKPVQGLLAHRFIEINNIVQGSISGSTGLIIDSSTRVCTENYIPWEENMLLMVNSNLKFSLRYYNENKVLIGSDGEWTDGCGFVTKNGSTIPGYVRIIFAFRNDATITPSTVGDVTIIRSSVSVVDKTLTMDGKAADAKTVGGLIEGALGKISSSQVLVGNMTVRAAKIINFADGTPPMVDWYLLQSIDNKFYMSKDLVSRKYLFTTVGSGMSGYVANWSVGITPENDVIFIADAAGLDTTAHGRLSDDNRINPFIFIASENYEKAHMIDFGTSLKPCGWLGNVGYCILPNGNIVFCEYTRGTVKTANVWLISGDITNPSNWTSTWSANIIDTLDSTTPGIKHCHEVMNDFYTGILYFGTGDSESGSYNYFSTDGGETWTQLCEPSKKKCRRLNYIFTEDKIYWGADSFEAENRYFFIAERDGNGVIDIDNATEISLTSGNGQACYGCVYLQEQGLIVLMDRQDDPQQNYLNWYCYDLTDNQIHLIGKIHAPNQNATWLGFRCEYIDYYPTGNVIVTGFNPRQAEGGSDINRNGLCGNNPGGDGNGSTRINNLLMYVYKAGSNYSYRAKTMC